MSDCICHVDGYCERYKQEMRGRSREICRGENIDPVKAEKYRQNWAGEALASDRTFLLPGDALKSRLDKLSIYTAGGCGCNSLVKEMNDLGLERCRAQRDR